LPNKEFFVRQYRKVKPSGIIADIIPKNIALLIDEFQTKIRIKTIPAPKSRAIFIIVGQAVMPMLSSSGSVL